MAATAVTCIGLWAALAAGAGAAAPQKGIVLGGPWAPGQKGYGTVRPREINNGGDPTGIVKQIRWRTWGGATATGRGIADYSWPGLSVATGYTRAQATVVAFGRARCRGKLVYRHLAWYFPGYGDTLHREDAFDLCKKDPYPDRDPVQSPCPDVTLPSARVATGVVAFDMTCTEAASVIGASGADRYAQTAGRFRSGAFYCGTDAVVIDPAEPARIECRRDRKTAAFGIAP